MPEPTPPQLRLTPNIADTDDFYDELLHAHDGLSKQQSDDLNARLILLLCNHIGDRQIIREALAAALASATEQDSVMNRDHS